MTEEEFFLFCQEMQDYHVEREADGTILIMEITGSETGSFNAEITTEVNLWNRSEKKGKTFDSSSGFTLPNQAVRSPDAAWIALERWQALPPEDRKRFAHISPDFVIEIRSESDKLAKLKDKMQEYIDQGVRLAWLIDPVEGNVWIYRSNGSIDLIDSLAEVLSGEDVMAGFSLRPGDFLDE